MATKRINSYTVTVYTLGGGEFSASDSADAKNGYNAYQQLLHHEMIVIVGDEADVYIPFHAVDHAVVSHSTETAEYSDNNCVVASESE